MASWIRKELRAVLLYKFAGGLYIEQCLEEKSLALDKKTFHIFHIDFIQVLQVIPRVKFLLENDKMAGWSRKSVTVENVTAARKKLDKGR